MHSTDHPRPSKTQLTLSDTPQLTGVSPTTNKLRLSDDNQFTVKKSGARKTETTQAQEG
jgi:hypothetical protein